MFQPQRQFSGLQFVQWLFNEIFILYLKHKNQINSNHGTHLGTIECWLKDFQDLKRFLIFHIGLFSYSYCSSFTVCFGIASFRRLLIYGIFIVNDKALCKRNLHNLFMWIRKSCCLVRNCYWMGLSLPSQGVSFINKIRMFFCSTEDHPV